MNLFLRAKSECVERNNDVYGDGGELIIRAIHNNTLQLIIRAIHYSQPAMLARSGAERVLYRLQAQGLSVEEHLAAQAAGRTSALY